MFDEIILDAFLERQGQLYLEPVAESRPEAIEFLEEAGACVCDCAKDVLTYMKENADVAGLSDEEILDSEEVFPIPDGRFLIVEG